MLGVSLSTSHGSCNQMLLTDQLTEHRNDHLDLKIFSNFLSCTRVSAKSFRKMALKFGEDLIKIFIHLVIHQVLEITG